MVIYAREAYLIKILGSIRLVHEAQSERPKWWNTRGALTKT